eukprot:jgi/Bigna1/89914/estExt_fgenesh1_pg.C_580022
MRGRSGLADKSKDFCNGCLKARMPSTLSSFTAHQRWITGGAILLSGILLVLSQGYAAFSLRNESKSRPSLAIASWNRFPNSILSADAALKRVTEALAASTSPIKAKCTLPDAIVVLGGGRPKDVHNPPEFVKNRCDIAAKIHKEAKKHGRNVYIVPISAGSAHAAMTLFENGMPLYESHASADYLVALPVVGVVGGVVGVNKHGIDPKMILMETTSFDTIANAYFTRTQFADVMGWKCLWVVTSSFHAPRTRAIFDWIFGVNALPSEGVQGDGNEDREAAAAAAIASESATLPRDRYSLTYIGTENVGLTEDEVRVRELREARSVKNVEMLAKEKRTLRDVLLFLMTDHRL